MIWVGVRDMNPKDRYCHLQTLHKVLLKQSQYIADLEAILFSDVFFSSSPLDSSFEDKNMGK